MNYLETKMSYLETNEKITKIIANSLKDEFKVGMSKYSDMICLVCDSILAIPAYAGAIIFSKQPNVLIYDSCSIYSEDDIKILIENTKNHFEICKKHKRSVGKFKLYLK